MIDLGKMRVWYDRRRSCYVSNAAIVAGRQVGVHPWHIAVRLSEWMNERYPQYESWPS